MVELTSSNPFNEGKKFDDPSLSVVLRNCLAAKDARVMDGHLFCD